MGKAETRQGGPRYATTDRSRMARAGTRTRNQARGGYQICDSRLRGEGHPATQLYIPTPITKTAIHS
jgi:hypothetical protein